MNSYAVTFTVEVKAENPAEAAREADRLLWTNRPRDFAVTSGRQPTVFFRVSGGEVKKIA